MLECRTCEPDHIGAVIAQPEQADEHEMMISQSAVLASCFALSFWDDVECVGGLGIVPIWPGMGQAWAVFGKSAGRHMLAITRHGEYLLNTVPFKRVQTTVRCDFAAGHRWMKALGFEMEAERMKAYDLMGRDHALYARVRA